MSERKGIYYGAISGVGDDATDLVPSSVRSAGGGGRIASNLEAAMRAGNVNVSDNVETEVLQLSESSRAAQEKHALLLRRIEAEKRARNIAVPTSVEEVIRRLRQLGEPITLFGERPADRRERLREILSRLELEAEETGFVHQVLADIQNQGAVPGGDKTSTGETKAGADQSDKPQEDQLFYVPIKNEQLKKVRAAIFDHTTSVVGARLKRERQEKHMSEEERARTVDHHAAELYATTLRMANIASQNGDVRPLASVRYSADGAHVATGSWSSLVKVWDATSAAEIKVFRGHEDRVTGVAWHPNNTFSEMTDGADSVCLISGSADGTARIWSAGRSEPLAVLRGHKARLGKVAFHPLGNYVGTTSFDHTWRLWDVATARELLLQEGHYKEVYAIAFQKDGALAATGDLNGNGRVWDLRSGKAILPLQGHSKQILSMDFAANGVQIASGSDDRSVRIWDLRQQKCSYMVPAHSNLVSEVRFSPVSSELLLSASYDSSIKLWRTRDWKCMKTLRGHDGKVMSADFAPDEKHVVSCGFDRTFKLAAVSPAVADTCSAGTQKFSVVVATSAPLGLRLSEKLEVLEFVADSEGRSRTVEASGLAEIGDRLIAVNDVSLEGFTLQKAVEVLQAAQLPRTLHFQTHDGRCIQPPQGLKTSTIDAASGAAVTYDPVDEETYDYVVSSVGDKATELKLYAVLSSDGGPPSCEFRELVLARPFDACGPLTIDVVDKFVLVASVFGCPMHQKAAMADEAGAKGVIFVQRVGEKPLRVRIPPVSAMPQAIRIPLAMVSTDSGARLLEQMAGIRPYEVLQLRFVFSATCAADRFAVHPEDNDPLRRSAAFLIGAASAGFLSVSVASSADSELLTETYEFLKPADHNSAASSSANLPLGRQNLFFPDAKIFDPCEVDPMLISPLVRTQQGKLVDTFVAVRLRDPKTTGSSLTAAVAVQQISVPVVFVSTNGFRTIRQKVGKLEANTNEDNAPHVQVEFSGENALEHQWKELASLTVASNWPMSQDARDRLFHRMLKDQASLDDHDMQLALVKNERYEALVAAYWNAQRYYNAHAKNGHEDSTQNEQEDESEDRRR
ncbi:U4/U6 small nuclear ribonucleoprotein Prp4 [Phytophthora boehmeriae]|uniref:U4/U6 small nuclear ribonucleoprotein Prp4 n=1 Tax=Phytophthora boehmeriae TaxID=109152 RepID=A0A8T1X639_9STRA|nr:U4/U6 small nuclear ribonucleoprotein Prp4 [Phytophthora boehmeriae]